MMRSWVHHSMREGHREVKLTGEIGTRFIHSTNIFECLLHAVYHC